MFRAAPFSSLPSPALAGDTPPPAVIAAVKQQLKDGGSNTHMAARLLQPACIGKASAWRADFEKASATDWCGSDGCRVMLFAQHGRQWKAVFDRQLLSLKLTGDGTALTVEIYGRNCGKAGKAACMAHYRWNAEMAEWQSRDNAPSPIEHL